MMIQRFTIVLLIFLISCKDKAENEKINKTEVSISERDTNSKINCFQKSDSLKIEQETDECNTVAVYYNYITKIIDDDEEYSSESTFILYFTKTVDGNILLGGIEFAG